METSGAKQAPPQKPAVGTGTNVLWIAVLAFYLAVVAGYAWFEYQEERRTLIEHIDARLRAGAAAVPHILPEGFHDRTDTARSISEAQDQRNIRSLSAYARQGGFKFLYAMIRSDGRIRFTASSATQEELESGEEVRYFAPYDSAGEGIERAFDTGEPVSFTQTDAWGTFRTAALPRVSPDGRRYVVAADYEIDYLETLLWQKVVESLAVALVLLVAIVPLGWMTLYTNRLHLRRLRQANTTLNDEVERRQGVEQDLRREKDFFETTINSLPGIFYLFDENDRIVRWNRNYEQLTGLGEKRIRQMGALAPVAEEDRGKAQKSVQECFESGEASVEVRFAAADDSKIPYHCTGKRMTIDGRRYLVGMGVDISDRLRMEEELRRHRDQLDQRVRERTSELQRSNRRLTEEIRIRRRAEKQLTALIESTPVGLVVVDRRGRITSANKLVEALFGYDSDELTGAELDLLVPARYRTQHRQECDNFMKEEGDRRMGASRDLWALRKDGSEFPVEIGLATFWINGERLAAATISDISERKRLEAELRRLATIDPLTGLQNRRAFFEESATELQRARRYDHPLAVFMLDIDYFKKINDRYGHAVGDEVLRAAADTTREALRENDLLCRFGGEEFAGVLVECAMNEAREVCQRLREQLAEMPVETENGTVRFTVSIGLSAVRADDDDIEVSMKRADDALYAAKRGGRNRLETA